MELIKKRLGFTGSAEVKPGKRQAKLNNDKPGLFYGSAILHKPHGTAKAV